MDSRSKPKSWFLGEQNLKKYQEESTKVSSVSVSLTHFFPSIVTDFHSFFLSNGLPLDLRSISSGNLTGSWSFGTVNTFPSGSYAIGIGQPQYLCLETPQSFNLKLIFFFPILFSSKISIVFIIDSSGTLRSFKKSEFIILPAPV